MNTPAHSKSNTQLDRQLDRLVDGELSSTEYRALLTALDEQPEAWRRCALAFLQAQALGGELNVLRGECLEPAPTPAAKEVSTAEVTAPAATKTVAGASSGEFWRQPWFLTLAMAGSFLIALPLGPLLFRLEQEPEFPLASEARPTTPDNANQAAVAAAPAVRQHKPLGQVRLVMDGPDRQSVDVPYYHVDDAGKLPGSDTEAILSPEMQRALEQAGNRVEREQSLVPVSLEDGSRVLVPLDRLRVTPVRNRVFQ